MLGHSGAVQSAPRSSPFKLKRISTIHLYLKGKRVKECLDEPWKQARGQLNWREIF